jgi:hypothetical protein
MIKTALSNLFPRQITNEFSGFENCTLGLLFTYSHDTLAKSTSYIFIRWWRTIYRHYPIRELFRFCCFNHYWDVCFWGLSQLIIGIIYVIAAIRYRSMIPMLYLLSVFEYLMRATYIPAYKSIETAGTAPGAIGKSAAYNIFLYNVSVKFVVS